MIWVTVVMVYGQTHRIGTLCISAVDTKLWWWCSESYVVCFLLTCCRGNGFVFACVSLEL